MKAVTKTKNGFGNVTIADLDEPACPKNFVKIKVAFTGVCGTDLHILHDTFMNFPPVVLGHEFSGWIEEVGSEVEKFTVGDRVTVLPSIAETCGECQSCKEGYYMFCPERKGMGYALNGSMTQYVTVRENMVYPLPEAVSLEVGALAEPLACAVQALEELTPIQAGDKVLISGPGPIGLLSLSLLASRGIQVIVAGTTDDGARLKLAQQLGACRTVDVLQENLQEVIQNETNGRGADVAVECAGAEASIQGCLHALKKRGKMIQVGIVGKKVSLDYDTVLYKQLSLYGSVGHSMKTWERVSRLFEQNNIPLAQVITHQFPISKWKEAFDACERKEGGKVLLYYDF